MNRLSGLAFGIVLALGLVCAGAARAQDLRASMGGNPPPCQILDKASGSFYHAFVGYTADSDFGSHGSSSMIDIEGSWEFAYYRDFLMGDLDVRADLGLLTLEGAQLDLPPALINAAVNGGMTWRTVNDMAFQFRARPGAYSDMRSLGVDDFFLPFSGSLIWAVYPSLSGLIGMEVRPGFDRVLMPQARIEWEASDAWRVRAGLPESRVTCYGIPGWEVYGALDWRSESYHLNESRDTDREMLTLEDFRLLAGMARSINEELQVTAEIGYTFDRSVEFEEVEEKNEEKTVDIDSALFFRIGLVGPF